MRLRNVKNKEEILNNSKFLIKEPEKYKGKWFEIFKNNNPIYLEIGMGKGKFIIESAINNPDINFIGMEKYDSVVARALPKINEDISNLVVLRYNALEIEKVFDHEIDRLYLNFSDPWPKDRHSNRRLTSHVFLKKYDNIFKDNCMIHMKTDNTDLFNYSIESLMNYNYKLSNVTLDLHHLENELSITTEYEEKFILENKPIHFLIATKVSKIIKK